MSKGKQQQKKITRENEKFTDERAWEGAKKFFISTEAPVYKMFSRFSTTLLFN